MLARGCVLFFHGSVLANRYRPYWAARAHLLQRSGAVDAADAAYAQAIGQELDPAVRRFLQQQAELKQPPQMTQ